MKVSSLRSLSIILAVVLFILPVALNLNASDCISGGTDVNCYKWVQTELNCNCFESMPGNNCIGVDHGGGLDPIIFRKCGPDTED